MLDCARKLLFVVVVVPITPVVVGIMNAPTIMAQSRESDQLPAFEVASVKPAAPSSGGRVRSRMQGGPGTSDTDRIIFTSVTLMGVLLRAYDVKPYQTAGVLTG